MSQPVSDSLTSTNEYQDLTTNAHALGSHAHTPGDTSSTYTSLDLILHEETSPSDSDKVLRKRAKKRILHNSVDIGAVMRFGQLKRMERLQILSHVREFDKGSREKAALPAATALTIFTLSFISGGLHQDGMASLVFLLELMVGAAAVLWSAKHDAGLESRQNAWLKAFETIDAEATKREESTDAPG